MSAQTPTGTETPSIATETSLEANVCAKPGCNKPANKVCAACNPPKTHYCSAKCQKNDFKIHKMTCVGTQKVNCFLIRATAANGGKEDVDHIEQYHLRSHGNYYAERDELKSRLGWRMAVEAGQFYSHDPNIKQWHYVVYHTNVRGKKVPINQIATRCLGKTIRGDVAVIRSAPADGLYKIPEEFSRRELLAAAEHYKTHNASQINSNHARREMCGMMGLPPGYLDGVPHIHIQL
ncbi:hypothetical protein N7493_008840 [Penicillium malachiteum]|uniref:MYND-type domain-containing protein n=1 Tax=Penicillium malachiteum TaxID=1324776 RepID=A0AAD6HFD1_9EURO|nr:hypothetical protein N7493_008840 [Penicillium malachiteum]